jgi:outer membrane protein
MLKMRSVCAVVLSCAMSMPMLAQTQVGTGWPARFTQRWRPRAVSATVFEDSPRVERLMRAGILYLSLRDAIALALENNLDLENARINPKLQESNLRRAEAGQLLRNVSTSISSGPSSASLGVGAGSNALGAGSVGGSGGGQGGVLSGLNVQLAGSSIPDLDPKLTASWQIAHQTQIYTSSFTTGANSVTSEYQGLNWQLSKGFLTGTNVSMSMNNTIGLNQNSYQNQFNPTTTASLSVTASQQLLQGFGLAVNNRAIRVARNQLKTSASVFQQQVIATVTNVVNLYWDLVTYNNTLRVRKQSLALNKQLYEDNKRRAELGAIAEIEIIQAEAEMESSQQDVTTAELQVLQQETILKSVLTRTGADNPAVAMARIVPTDVIRVPDVEPVRPTQDLIAEALKNRPEVEQTRMSLENARISMLGTKSALLPSLTAFVSMSNNATAGQVNSLPVPITDATGQPVYINGVPQSYTRSAANVNQYFLGGYGTVLAQLFRRNFPNYSAGIQLSVSLRNRSAQADLVTDQLNYRQSEISERQQLNSIKLNVLNAATALVQARSAYDTSVRARKLQEQTFAGQRRKHELGSLDMMTVVIGQRDTVARELSEVSALSQYLHARTNMQQLTATILNEYGVDLEEAQTGTVKREPDMIPAVGARQ